jgi:hypothetical protein
MAMNQSPLSVRARNLVAMLCFDIRKLMACQKNRRIWLYGKEAAVNEAGSTLAAE